MYANNGFAFKIQRYPFEEGDEICLYMKIGNDKLKINYFHLKQSTYEKAMMDAGFIDFKYEPILYNEDAPE